MGRPKKYKDISIGDIYNRWTVIGEKRDIPKKNSKGFTHQWYCECSCENHTRKWVTDNQLTSGRSKSCGCLRKETSIKQNNCKTNYSFEQWCTDINRLDYLDRYDYEKNILNPSELSMQSHRGVWLKCNKHDNHPSQHFGLNQKLKELGNDIEHFQCKYCKSFAQWCIDNNRNDLLNRWDYELNDVSPYEISIETPYKYYFKCPINKHKSEKKLICSLSNGIYGGFKCSGCNSFGEYIEKTYGTEYLNSLWDYHNNSISPYEISKCNSSKKIYINCLENNEHGSYLITPSHYQDARRCPICGRDYLSKLHKAVIRYLKELNLDIRTEHDCTIKPINPDTGYVLPYDIEIVDYKIIIEVQGKQHSKLLNENHPWLKKLTPQEYLDKRIKYDKIKKNYAIENGYRFLEIYPESFKNDNFKRIIQEEISNINTL